MRLLLRALRAAAPGFFRFRERAVNPDQIEVRQVNEIKALRVRYSTAHHKVQFAHLAVVPRGERLGGSAHHNHRPGIAKPQCRSCDVSRITCRARPSAELRSAVAAVSAVSTALPE